MGSVRVPVPFPDGIRYIRAGIDGALETPPQQYLNEVLEIDACVSL